MRQQQRYAGHSQPSASISESLGRQGAGSAHVRRGAGAQPPHPPNAGELVPLLTEAFEAVQRRDRGDDWAGREP